MSNDNPFTQKIKDIYKSQDKLAQIIEGLSEIPQQSLKDYFVKLQTIIKEDDEKKSSNYESISGEKADLDIEDIFEGASKVLILGGAGVGKSTLLQFFAYKWGLNDIWKGKFDYVYRISLKTLLNTNWKTTPWAYESKDLNESLLKCLAHFTLTSNMTFQQRKATLIDQMPWGDFDKTLLLLDGYDEIAHLQTRDEFIRVFEEIFEHNYIVLTTRPHAMVHDMKARFEKKIEITGLDEGGIDQYAQQYFKSDHEKGHEFNLFLQNNPVIKGICKIPVNMAMICYIWSEEESGQRLKEISGLSNLYYEVVEHLGKRFLAKKWKDDHASLKDALENGELALDELKVLSHTAYKGMTGGGVEKSHAERVETLIIKGAHEKGNKLDLKDENAISIQSSINYLAKYKEIAHQGEKVTIADIYKYGLLKVEAGSSSENKESETHLQKQNFNFIHLTFQEYLTAYYLKRRLELGDAEEKTKICQYLAEHRAEPRYLMTNKFLAGLITSDHREEATELVNLFWEAMICNVDGILEVGADDKVSLLLNLLSQAKIRDEVDERIPNIKQVLNFIDAVMLLSPLSWDTQIRESDYLSTKMKEGLFKALKEGNLSWHNSQVKEIGAKFPKELISAFSDLLELRDKENNDDTQKQPDYIIGQAIELLSRVSHKLTSEEKESFIKELENVLVQPYGWLLKKQTIQRLEKLIKEPKKSENLAHVLIPLTTDKNLGRTALKALIFFYGIVDKEPREKIQDKILHQIQVTADGNDSDSIEALESVVCEILKVLKPSDPFYRVLLDLTIKLFQHNNWRVIMVTQQIITEIIESFNHQEINQSIYDAMIKIIDVNRDSSTQGNAADVIMKLVNKSAIEMYRAAADITSFLSSKNDLATRKVAFSFILSLLQAVRDTYNPKFVQGSLAQANKLIGDENFEMRAIAGNIIAEAIGAEIREGKISDLEDNASITNLIQLLKDPESYTRGSASGNITDLTKVSNSQPFIKKAIGLLVSALSDSEWPVRKSVSMKIVELITSPNGNRFVETVFDHLLPCLNDTQDHVRSTASDVITDILEISGETSFASKALHPISKLITDPESLPRRTVAKNIKALLQMSNDTTLARDLTKQIMKLLEDPDFEVREGTAMQIPDLIVLCDDPELRAHALDELIKLFGDQETNVVQEGINNATELIKLANDKALASTTIEKMIELLPSSDIFIQDVLLRKIGELIKITDYNTDLIKKFIDQLAFIFESPEISVMTALRESIVDLATSSNDAKLTDDIISQISNLFTHSHKLARQVSLKVIGQLMATSNNLSLAETMVPQMIALLKDPSPEVRSSAIQNLIEVSTVLRSAESAVAVFEQIIKLCNDENPNVRQDAVQNLLPLINIAEDQTLTEKLYIELLRLTSDPAGFVKESVEQVKSNLLTEYSLPKEEKYNILNILSKENRLLRDKVFGNLMSAFQAILAKIHLLALVKDQSSFDPNDIMTNLFPNLTDTKRKDSIITQLNSLAKDSFDVKKIKTFLFYELHQIGNRKGDEFLELALSLIDSKELFSQENKTKEFRELCKQLLDQHLKYLDEKSLANLNAHFNFVSFKSKGSKHFLRRLYHKLLADFDLNTVKKELIIKFIKSNFSTSLNRDGELLFEGKRYALMGSNVTLLIEELARGIVQQKGDLLAQQYITHKAIFPKSFPTGIKKAAVEIEYVASIVDRSKILSNSTWLLFKLQSSNKEIILIEQRSVIGDHLIYQVSEKAFIRVHPLDESTKRQTLFGESAAQQKYFGSFSNLTVEKVDSIVSEGITDLKGINFERSRDYFQDELLGLGNTERLDHHDNTLKLAGVYTKAEIARGYEELSKGDPELYAYCKTFYWTLLNLLGGYRSASTGLLTSNIDYDQSTKEKMLVYAQKGIVAAGTEIAKAIPLVGGVLGALDSIIDTVYTAIKENRFQNRVNATNKVLQNKFRQEEDISSGVALVALAMTQMKEKEILNPKQANVSRFGQKIEWLKSKIEPIQNKILPEIQLYDSNSAGAKLALQDVALAMAYIYKNSEEIVKSPEPFEQNLTDAALDKMLEDMNIPPAAPAVSTEKTCGCNMFVLSAIIYDNPLLNDPTLVKILAKNNILSQVLNTNDY